MVREWSQVGIEIHQQDVQKGVTRIPPDYSLQFYPAGLT